MHHNTVSRLSLEWIEKLVVGKDRFIEKMRRGQFRWATMPQEQFPLQGCKSKGRCLSSQLSSCQWALSPELCFAFLDFESHHLNKGFCDICRHLIARIYDRARFDLWRELPECFGLDGEAAAGWKDGPVLLSDYDPILSNAY